MALVQQQFPVADNVYSRAVTFLYGSFQEINDYLKDQPYCSEDELRPSSRGKYVCIRHNGYEADFICVVRDRDRAAEMACLAHEVLHHAGHVLRNAGLPFTEDGEEAYCYYQEWVVRNCLRVMRPNRSPLTHHSPPAGGGDPLPRPVASPDPLPRRRHGRP